jgi:hypothetical protein
MQTVPVEVRAAASLCVTILSLVHAQFVCAAEPVTIVLSNGRSVSGQVDQQSDGERLWLRREEAGTSLSSGFAWDEIASATHGRKTLNRDQLQIWAMKQRSPSAAFQDLKSVPRTRAKTIKTIDRPVQTLVIESALGQWDNDSQADGLRILVSPLDAQGKIVPIDGQIEFTLVVEIEKLSGGQSGSLTPKFIEVERASRMVKRADFAKGPAVFEIPFTSQHPEFDTTISPLALLHARLGVPGRGVYEASDDQVCLRPCNRLRDQMQYYSPSRQLPLESGGQRNR